MYETPTGFSLSAFGLRSWAKLPGYFLKSVLSGTVTYSSYKIWDHNNTRNLKEKQAPFVLAGKTMGCLLQLQGAQEAAKNA